jgi:hypothetical protein
MRYSRFNYSKYDVIDQTGKVVHAQMQGIWNRLAVLAACSPYPEDDKQQKSKQSYTKKGLKLPAQTKCMVNDLKNGTFNHWKEQEWIIYMYIENIKTRISLVYNIICRICIRCDSLSQLMCVAWCVCQNCHFSVPSYKDMVLIRDSTYCRLWAALRVSRVLLIHPLTTNWMSPRGPM